MFLGEFEYKVDNKGRLPIPPKFRKDFSDGLVATRGVEQCIVVYRAEVFDKGAGPLATEEIIESQEQRNLKRAIFASAEYLTLDGQGRIALHARLKKHAGIEDEVVIVGLGDRIEIWNPVIWRPVIGKAEDDAPKLMENIKGKQ
jgi:MraZ protein